MYTANANIESVVELESLRAATHIYHSELCEHCVDVHVDIKCRASIRRIDSLKNKASNYSVLLPQVTAHEPVFSFMCTGISDTQ